MGGELPTPDDEFYAIRGDRPPDGCVDGFAVWDPINCLGFREDDQNFPPPPELEALRRLDQASSDLSEDIARYRDLTSGE